MGNKIENGNDFCKQYENNCINCPITDVEYCESVVEDVIKDLYNKGFIIIAKENEDV